MHYARPIPRLTIAPLTVGLAFVLKLALQPVVEPGTGAFAFFAGAVTVSAWLGGLLPGLIAIGLATVTAVVAFLPPAGTFLIEGVTELHRIMAFILEGLIICLVCHLFHRARERAESLTIEAREALKARRTSEARFRRLAESDVIGIIEGRGEAIIKANDAFLRMLGYSRDRLEGRGLAVAEITPEAFRERDDRLFEELFRAGTLPPFEKEYLTADGRLVPILAGGALIEPGGIDWIAFVLDLTRQKEVERELARAISRAEAASRAKSEFLAILSHELITPMNAILGMNQLAMAGQRDPVIKDYLATAQESAEALLALLSDLLDYSSIEVGGLELEPGPFRLRAMLDRAVSPLEERATRKGLYLDSRVDDDVPDLLFGDSRRLRQVLVNLLDNAIKFTRRGKVTLAIGLEPDRTPADGDGDGAIGLRIEVADTGIGIAAEDRERIFSPFTQIDGSSTRPYSGTGLGLSICRQIVGLMGGSIDLKSEPGQGTRFVVSITTRAASRAEFEADRSSADASLVGLPALVAIEGEQEREAVESILLARSMRPKTAADGRTALRLLAEAAVRGAPFPVVLFDDRLPDLDPIETAARIRRDRLADSVILIASEKLDMASEPEGADGTPAVLRRPVEPDRLVEAILLALRPESRPPSGRGEPLPTDRPMRILLAEDTPANQKLVLAVLGNRGHRVDLAANGREAVDLALQTRYDLILMDLQMPVMDGLQATIAIRFLDTPDMDSGTGSSPGVPIVALTAHASPEDRRRCLEAGMNDYLSKPIDISMFLDVVESFSGSADGRGTGRLRPLGSRPPAGIVLGAGGSDRMGDERPAGSDGEPAREDAEERTVDRDHHDRPIPIYDRPGALRRLGGDEELFRDMIGFYLDDYPALLDQLCKGLLSDDPRAVERAAHSLKGLAANSGAGPAVQAAGVVEDIGRSGRLVAAPEAVEHLVAELQRLSDALRAELAPASDRPSDP